MLDIAFIRQNPDVVRAAVTNKRLTLDVTALLEADRQRRELIVKLDERRARKNTLSASIPKAAADERPKLVAEAKEVRGEIEQLEPALLEANKVFDDLMLRVPSIPRPEVPLGKGEGGQRRGPQGGDAARVRLHAEGSRRADGVARPRELGWSAPLRRGAVVCARGAGGDPRARGHAARGRPARRSRHVDRAPAGDGEGAGDDRDGVLPARP